MLLRHVLLGAAGTCALLASLAVLREGYKGEDLLYSLMGKAVSENGPGLGITPEEMREVMLNGELAAYWRVVDQKAPQDLTAVIDRFFADEAMFQTQQDVRERLEEELLSYRLNLAKYAPLLTDAQRIRLLNARIAILQAFDDPRTCGVIARHGGGSLSYNELVEVADELEAFSAIQVAYLLDARISGREIKRNTPPKTRSDVELLVRKMRKTGTTEHEMQILFNDDWKDPKYCGAKIKFLESLVGMPGLVGEALRAEEVQNALNGP